MIKYKHATFILIGITVSLLEVFLPILSEESFFKEGVVLGLILFVVILIFWQLIDVKEKIDKKDNIGNIGVFEEIPSSSKIIEMALQSAKVVRVIGTSQNKAVKINPQAKKYNEAIRKRFKKKEHLVYHRIADFSYVEGEGSSFKELDEIADSNGHIFEVKVETARSAFWH